MALMQCPMCGAYSPTDAKVCYRCSFVFVPSQPAPTPQFTSPAPAPTPVPQPQPAPQPTIESTPKNDANNYTSIPQPQQHAEEPRYTNYAQTPVQQNSKKGLIIGLIVAISILTVAVGIFAGILLFGNQEENSDNPVGTETAELQPILEGRWPFTSARQITDSDLYGMNLADLRLMRNEIYARRGFIFGKQDLIRHFSQQSWYQPLHNNVTLSDIESHNVKVIVEQENRLKAASNNNKYVGEYPFTSTRKVTEEDLYYRSAAELRIMRNEIYARNGYIFDNEELHYYFSQKSWYQPYTYNPTLNKIEQYNIMFIKEYENNGFDCCR